MYFTPPRSYDFMKSMLRFLSLIILMFCVSSCTPSSAESIVLPPETIRIDINGIHNIEPVVKPNSNVELEYCSGNDSIASYCEGVLIGKSVGTCNIYVKSGKIMSNLACVEVHDFVEEAKLLKKDIDEYYGTGMETDNACEYFKECYDSFPEYAKEIVDNFYIVALYLQGGCKAERVYMSGKKYHLQGCYDLPEEYKIVLRTLAEYEGAKACKRCNP